jgi:hypothetical protein
MSVYLFKSIGEKEIMQHVEDAFRNPEKAAALVRRAQQLPGYQPPEAVKQIAERVLTEPKEVGKEALQGAWSLTKKALSKVKSVLENYSSAAIQRAVRLGLLPAQAESRKMDVETDYRLGPPFIYRDNIIRFDLELRVQGAAGTPPPNWPINVLQDVGTESILSAEPPVPPANVPSSPPPPPLSPMGGGASLQVPSPLEGTMLSRIDPFAQRQFADTRQRGQEVFGPMDTVFANKGGIVSLRKKKPRQMVY